MGGEKRGGEGGGGGRGRKGGMATGSTVNIGLVVHAIWRIEARLHQVSSGEREGGFRKAE